MGLALFVLKKLIRMQDDLRRLESNGYGGRIPPAASGGDMFQSTLHFSSDISGHDEALSEGLSTVRKRASQGLLRPYEDELHFLARVMDTAVIVGSVWAANRLTGDTWRDVHTAEAALACIFFYLFGHGAGLYRWVRGAPLMAQVKAVGVGWMLTCLVLAFVAFATKTTADHSRRAVTLWALLAPAGIASWRLGLELFVYEARSRGFNTRKAAIVGASHLGAKLAARISAAPWTGLRICGFYDDRGLERSELATTSPWEFRGHFDRLINDARSGSVDVVYIALPLRAEPRIADLIRKLSDTTASVHLAYDFGGFDLLRANWSSVGGIPVMSVVEHPFHGVAGTLKRIEDLVIATGILLFTGIPMLLIALGVKLSSPGPVFFRQRRYGLNGEEIRVLKFRTMTSWDDGDNVPQAHKSDSRVTRLGSFLRRTSLDELPQFLQVLSGTMSVVGPRPHAVAHNEEFRAKIQGYMLRHKVKPGITGLAQIHGWRGETDTLGKMEKRVEYDLEYIRNWTLTLDLQIILRTLRQVLGHRNAY